MKNYSLGTNLTYVLMAFSKPQLLIEHYLTESSLLYGIIPAIVSEVLYEFLGSLNYLLQPQSGSSFNPIAQALRLAKREISLLQIVTHPDLLVTFRPLGWGFGFLDFIHPFAALACVVYLTEFIHRQAEMDKWKSLALVLPSVIVVLTSRTIFIP
jgi:hypothetical protein